MGVLQYDSRKKYFDGMGTEVQSTDLDQIYKLSGLDYIVEKVPLFYEDGTEAEGCFGTRTQIDGKNVTLGHVGEQYTILQNYQAFDFLRDIVASGELKVENAGITNGGKSSYLCCSTEPMKILDDDISPYMVFNNSFDGSSGVKVILTPIRVFCSNCMQLAIRQATSKISIKHSTNVHQNLYIAKDVLLQNTKYLESIKETMEELATMRLTRKQFADTVTVKVLQFMGLYDADGQPIEKKRNAGLAESYREAMLAAWSANDLANYSNTAYSGIQAMLDWESHRSYARTKTKKLDLRRLQKVCLLVISLCRLFVKSLQRIQVLSFN